mgnify:CR=1 FL=1
MRQRRSSTIGGKNGLVGELRLAVGVDLFEAIGQLVHFVGKIHVGKAVALILQDSATALQETDRGPTILALPLLRWMWKTALFRSEPVYQESRSTSPTFLGAPRILHRNRCHCS